MSLDVDFAPLPNFDFLADGFEQCLEDGLNFPDLSEDVDGYLPSDFTVFPTEQPDHTLPINCPMTGEGDGNSSDPYSTFHNPNTIHPYPTPTESSLGLSSSLDSISPLNNSINSSLPPELLFAPMHGNHLTTNSFEPDEQRSAEMHITPGAKSIGDRVEGSKAEVNPRNLSAYSPVQSVWVPTLRSERSADGPGDNPYLNENKFPTAFECLMPAESKVDTATAFRDLNDALDWRAKDGRSPQDEDDTMPTNLEQQRALVKVLFKAFKSIARAVDNDAMIRPFKQMKHENARVEVVCWQILEACMKRCKSGSLVAQFDPNKSKSTTDTLTFAERFDCIVSALSSQKTICKHLFDAPFVNTFVDDPVRAKSRVESNRVLNERKGRTMRAGKAITGNLSESPKKRRRLTKEESASPDVHDSPYLTPIPSHRAIRSTALSRGDSYNSALSGSYYPGSSMHTYNGSPVYPGAYGRTGSLGSSPEQNASPFLSQSQSLLSPTAMTYQSVPTQAYSQIRSTNNGSMQRTGMDHDTAFSYSPASMPTLNKTYTVSHNYGTAPTSHPQPTVNSFVEKVRQNNAAEAHHNRLNASDASDESTDDSGDSEYVESPKKKARCNTRR